MTRLARPAQGFIAAGLVLLAWCGLISPAGAQSAGGRPKDRPGARVDTTAAERAVKALSPKYFTTYDITQQRKVWKQELGMTYATGKWSLDGNSTFDVTTDKYQDAVNKTGKLNISMTNSRIPRLPLNLRVSYVRNNFEGQDSRDDISTSVALGATHTRRIWGGSQTLHIETGLEGQQQENFNRSTGKTALTSNDGVKGTGSWTGTSKVGDWLDFTGRGSYSRSELTSRTTDRKAPTHNENKGISGDLKLYPATPLTVTVSGKTDAGNLVRTRSVSGVDAFVTTDTKHQALDISTAYTSFLGMKVEGGVGVYENNTFLRPDRQSPDLDQLVRQSNTQTGNSWTAKVSGETLGATYDSNLSSKFDEIVKLEDDPSRTYTNRWEGKASREFGLNEGGRPEFITKIDWYVELRQQKDVTAPKRKSDYDELRKKFAFAVDWDMNDTWTVGTTFEANTKDRIEQNARRAKSTSNDQVQTLSTNITYKFNDTTSLSQVYSIVADFRERIFDTSRNSSTISRRITTTISTGVLPHTTLGMVHRWALLKTSSFLDTPQRGLVVYPQSRTWTQDLSVDLRWEVLPWLTWVSQEQLIRRDLLREIDQSKTLISRDFRLVQGIDIKKELGVGFSVSGQGRYQRSNVRESYVTVSARLDKEF